MSVMAHQVLVLLSLLATLYGAALGQDARVAISPREPSRRSAGAADELATFRVNSDLVLVPVTVTDRADRAVTGLAKGDFRIFDDAVEQQISHFASEDAPVSLILVFDSSNSMSNKLQMSRMAVSEFLKSANPEDEFLFIEFNEGARVLAPFTNESEEIQKRLMFIAAQGRTALLDAINLALNEMKHARNSRKAILIVSDGGDNCSRYTEREIRKRIQEADVQIYSIGIMSPARHRAAPIEEEYGPALLSEIAEATGGRLFVVNNLTELLEAAAKIGTALRNQYLLCYSPSAPKRDGRYHRIRVRLDQPKLRVAFRSSYLAAQR